VGLVISVWAGGCRKDDDGLVDGEGDCEEGEAETDCDGEFSREMVSRKRGEEGTRDLLPTSEFGGPDCWEGEDD
jgi:hypothetical protein